MVICKHIAQTYLTWFEIGCIFESDKAIKKGEKMKNWYTIKRNGIVKKEMFGEAVGDNFKLADGRFLLTKVDGEITKASSDNGFEFVQNKHVEVKGLSADEVELLEDQGVIIPDVRCYDRATTADAI